MKMINFVLIYTLFVAGNVLLTNGFGALALQRNKNNFLFILVNSLCFGISIIAGALLYNLIYTYILDPYNLEGLSVLIIILLSGILNYLFLGLIKLTSKEMYYYYDSTYSFIINLAVLIAVLFTFSPTLSILETLCYSGFTALVYIITSLLFASFYKRLHNKKVSKIIRPVPITILTMAILAMIIYVISSAIL